MPMPPSRWGCSAHSPAPSPASPTGPIPTITSGASGIAHALVNGAALLLYGASFGLRLADRRGLARFCGVLGFGTVTAGGMLGGELVYTLGVNIPHTLYPKPPDEFVEVLASASLPEGTPVVVEAGRVPVLLLRREGAIMAVQNWCTHAGGPLDEGEITGDEVQCPWHGARFCLRDGATPARAGLRAAPHLRGSRGGRADPHPARRRRAELAAGSVTSPLSPVRHRHTTYAALTHHSR